MSFPSGPGGNFPPRPRNTLGFSLGAAGGPRGVGAGFAREILLSFITRYDKGQLEQLSKDLQALQAQQLAANQQLQQASQRQAAIEAEVNKARAGRANLDSAATRAMKAMLDIQARARAEEQTLGRVTAATTAEVLKRERAFRAVSGLTQLENAAIINQHQNQIALKTATDQTNTARRQAVSIEDQINAKMEQGIAIATLRAQMFARIRSLFFGAFGGIIGGAVVGAVLYEPLQNFINGIRDTLEDFTDPAKAAKEAIDEVGQSIRDMASDENISRMEAVQRVLEQMGGGTGPDARRFSLAADVTVLQEAVDASKERLAITAGVDMAHARISKELARQHQIELLVSGVAEDRQAQIAGALRMMSQMADLFATIGFPQMRDAFDDAARVTPELADDVAQAALDAERIGNSKADQALEDAAKAAADLRSELAQAAVADALSQTIKNIGDALDATTDRIRAESEASIDAIRGRADAAADAARLFADRRIDAIQERMRGLEVVESRRTKNLEAALDALEDAGPSRRTRELAESIERVNNAEERRAFRARLTEIREQRQAILLRERLRLSEEEIDLDDYRGKDRLIAIDALIDRMQRQNAEQDRFNKLLDIQYQMGQRVRRQQGETIREFVERRAQYYRGLLEQAADLRREGPQAELEAERQRVEVSIELRELERRRKELIEDRARQKYMESLQAQLAASQERDRRELDNRRDMLREMLQESRKADQQRLEDQRAAMQQQIENIRARTAEEIELINNRRDVEISARERARDRAIDTARAAAERNIEIERKRAESIKQWASYAEAERLAAAFAGARDVAELQRFAGQLAGANFSAAYIQTQLTALGVPAADQALILGNIAKLRVSYVQNMTRLAGGQPSPPRSPSFGAPSGGAGGQFQRGGVFPLRNSMINPFSKDIRYGEDGREELGVILSNRVVEQLRQNGGGSDRPLMGDVTMVSEDPYRDLYRLRNLVREVVREEVQH